MLRAYGIERGWKRRLLRGSSTEAYLESISSVRKVTEEGEDVLGLNPFERENDTSLAVTGLLNLILGQRVNGCTDSAPSNPGSRGT